MNAIDPVVRLEIPAIRKIIQDETWLEGERRGCQVAPSDTRVRERVCAIVLDMGQALRDAAMRQAARCHDRGDASDIAFDAEI